MQFKNRKIHAITRRVPNFGEVATKNEFINHCPPPKTEEKAGGKKGIFIKFVPSRYKSPLVIVSGLLKKWHANAYRS
jgi:hypothetical protein